MTILSNPAKKSNDVNSPTQGEVKMSNKKNHKQDSMLEKYLDFSDDIDPFELDAVIAMVESFHATRRYQISSALELTRLIAEKSTTELTEENIFASFKRALQIILEVYPSRKLLDPFKQHEMI